MILIAFIFVVLVLTFVSAIAITINDSRALKSVESMTDIATLHGAPLSAKARREMLDVAAKIVYQPKREKAYKLIDTLK